MRLEVDRGSSMMNWRLCRGICWQRGGRFIFYFEVVVVLVVVVVVFVAFPGEVGMGA